jgi:hypothetical protein
MQTMTANKGVEKMIQAVVEAVFLANAHNHE